jgi:1-aminocyclopropane-1-carboxylate deaminase
MSGIQGSMEILKCTSQNNYSHIVCAIGTGTMFAGIVNASLPKQKIIGITVLKGMKNLSEEIFQFVNQDKSKDFVINNDYHFGGYAKKNDDLIKFMNAFYQLTNIPSDFVYTGKLFYAVIDLIKKDYFPAKSKLLVIHSGGLQGNSSLPKEALIF